MKDDEFERTIWKDTAKLIDVIQLCFFCKVGKIENRHTDQ